MNEVQAVIAGVVSGAIAALPLVLVLFKTRDNQVKGGFAGVVAGAVTPFLLLQALILAVSYYWRPIIVFYGAFAAFSFLGTVVAGAILAQGK